MRPLARCALLLAATACAHASHPPRADAGEEMVRVGEAVFHLRYQPEDVAAAQQVKRALASAVPAATRWGTLEAPVHVTIHPSHEALEEAVQGPGQAWMRAWARYASVELQSPRTWSSGRASDEQMEQLLAHELTHCAMYQAIATEATWRSAPVPLWFKEGMASDAAGEDHGPPVNGDPRAAYARAEAAFRSLVERYGEARVRGLLARMSEGRPFAEAFHAAIGISLQEFERDVRRAEVSEASRASSRTG